MNRTDVRIVRAMGFAPFLDRVPTIQSVSPTHVARRLGLSAQAVKARLHVMEAAGIIPGYQVYPNFRLLGMAVTSIHVQARNKRMGLDAVEAMEGVWGVYDMQGSDVCLDIHAANDEDLDGRCRAACLALAGTAHALLEYRLPRVSVAMTPADWRIVAALRHAARRSLTDVAQEIGTSTRTVRRRLTRMDAAGALDAVAMFDPSRLDAGMAFLLMVTFHDPDGRQIRRTAMALLKDRWFAQWSPPSATAGHLCVQLVARSPREAEEVRREVESLPGVAAAVALIPAQARLNEDWIDAAIAQRALATDESAPMIKA